MNRNELKIEDFAKIIFRLALFSISMRSLQVLRKSVIKYSHLVNEKTEFLIN